MHVKCKTNVIKIEEKVTRALHDNSREAVLVFSLRPIVQILFSHKMKKECLAKCHEQKLFKYNILLVYISDLFNQACIANSLGGYT